MTLNANFKNKYGPWALIAGASEGIGLSFAAALAALGFNLVMVSRRADVLEANANALKKRFPIDIKTLAADLTSAHLLEHLSPLTQDIEIGLLIYNAGAMHGADLFHDNPVEKSLALIDLNCRGPVLLCHHYGDLMRQRKRGGIMMLSSMVAFSGGAYVAAYSATKAFDVVLAQSLWHELAIYNVDVMALVAGATNTPAMANSGIDFSAWQAGLMKSDDVAQEGLQHLGKGPLHIVGENNRAMRAALQALPETQVIEAMSMGAAMLYGKPYSAVNVNNSSD